MLITFCYLLVCALSVDISVDTNVFIPLIIVEGSVVAIGYVVSAIKKRK